MSRLKYTESNVPKNTYIRVHYLTQGKVQGMPSNVKRVTIATLKHSISGKKLSEGVSFCDNKDNDNRKIGRAIAVGRALKDYMLYNA